MFNLDESIKDWRNDLNKNDVLSLDDLDELESHLMDEITVLKEKDLSEEEAFLVAKSRIGQNDIIEEEYKKVNRNEIWFHKLFTLFIGFISFQFILILIRFIGLIVTVSVFSKYPLPNSPISSFSFGIQLGILLAIFTFIFSPLFPKVLSKFSALNIKVKSIIMLLILFFNFYAMPILSSNVITDLDNEYLLNYLNTYNFASHRIETLFIPIFLMLFLIVKKVKKYTFAKA